VLQHPLVDHWLLELRDVRTPSPRFRELLKLCGEALAFEVARSLPTVPATVVTPLEPFQGRQLKLPVTLVPILRAGLGLADGMLRLIAQAQVGHIGMFRNETDLTPVEYYEHLPDNIAQGVAILVDPMLATGGSAVAGVKLLRSRGCADIRMVCLVAAPEGVRKLHDAYPDVPIIAAALDRQLNNVGYILPGLGDAGDRQFGTMPGA
jgi:uracil phosphoribosyltransferase